MPSKKRKYNARFPAGRIKKIMQTDEEVGKVAQAVPIIISRTLELFVESLLGKALQVTSSRNAKTLSPSHVKQCILAEARFDFLRDLVKNIPDVSAAEEKEGMSAESSPNCSRFPDAAPKRIVREDSNSSSSCEVIRPPQPANQNICAYTREQLKRVLTTDRDKTQLSSVTQIPNVNVKIEPTPGTSIKIEPTALLNIPPIVSPLVMKAEASTSTDIAIDLSKKEPRPVRTANFYQETLITESTHSSVIKINPIYTNSQPSTSYSNLHAADMVRKVDITPKPPFERHNSLPLSLPTTPITPVINIDFTKNFAKPEIKVIDPAASVASVAKIDAKSKLIRQNSRSKMEVKKVEIKPAQPIFDIDSLNSGNLQIDEDYDT